MSKDMHYVDGFVFVVPKSKVKAYKKLALTESKIWKKHRALEYVECQGDDLSPPLSFYIQNKCVSYGRHFSMYCSI